MRPLPYLFEVRIMRQALPIATFSM
jgi:hypothetical protein